MVVLLLSFYTLFHIEDVLDKGFPFFVICTFEDRPPFKPTTMYTVTVSATLMLYNITFYTDAGLCRGYEIVPINIDYLIK